MIKEQPLVSVLMTVFNREKYLAQAIESVLASSYQNWELVVVDDCSKDKSFDVAKTYEANDSRVKVYRNVTNLGDYPNRNQAVNYSKGKYLKFVDADDLIYPYGLEQLVYYMEQFPDAAYGLCSLPQDNEKQYPFQLNPKQAYQRHYFHQLLFHKAPLSAIINRVCFENIGGFTGKRMLGDFEMWHLLSREYPVVLMPQGIVWYRKHEEQEMELHRKDPLVPFKYIMMSSKLLQHPDCPLDHTEIGQALENNKKKQARAILSAAKHHSISKALELFKASELSPFDVFFKFIKK